MIQNKLAIFASGRGSNAGKIIQYFYANPITEIALIVSNKKNADVLELASLHEIKSIHISKKHFEDEPSVLEILSDHGITHIILAGFLLMIPSYLIKNYPERIINIHPALLPKYGGKGMYGHHVHQAVHDNKENESGISIHKVNEKYDDGELIFQASCSLESTDSPEIIASKVLELEHFHYPRVIESWLEEKSI